LQLKPIFKRKFGKLHNQPGLSQGTGSMEVNQRSDNSSLSGGHDAPIKSQNDDFLGAALTARAIHRTIRSAPISWSTRIGLYGAWGSGKTSILNLLENLEKADNSIIVRFSAWSALGESGVLILFYEELVKQFQLENIALPAFGRAKRIVSKLGWFSKLFKGVGQVAEKIYPIPQGTSDAIAGVAESAFSWLAIERKDIDALVQRLEGRRVVVFIDDLDRTDPRLIPKTLLALRELLDWPGFSFVLAFDRRVVARALFDYSAAYGENAQTFLEKVVDVPFEIPTPNESQKAALASHAFKACCPFVPIDAVNASKAYLPDEPRRIKLIARKVGVLAAVAKRHSPGELDWFDFVLYHVVQEACPEAAQHLVEMATTEEDNWVLWLGDDEDKKAKEQTVRSSLEVLIKAATPLDVQRVVSAAMTLLRRWVHVEATQIRYLVGLAFEEPTFTRKEFASVFEQWLVQKNDRVLTEEIWHAAEIGNVTKELAACDLLTLAVERYGKTLHRIADSETEVVRASYAIEAGKLLSFLEHLWSECLDADIQAATKAGGLCRNFMSTIATWVGWSRNPGEGELRQREQDLAMIAALGCDDQESIYSDTDPYWESHHDGGKGDGWRALLRSTLNKPICKRLLERFSIQGGIENVARGEDNLTAWMLESIKSPFYTDANFAEQLAHQFSFSSGDDNALESARRDNAKLYLKILLNQARDATWGGRDRIGEIHGRFPQIIPAAWAVVARCRVPFRMASSILELRSQLVATGVSDEALEQPAWLKLAASELEALKAERQLQPANAETNP
jgi:hypothetical protein